MLPPLSPIDEARAVEAHRSACERGGFKFNPWPVSLAARVVGDKLVTFVTPVL